MNLKTAMIIGRDCGLTTVNEAIFNIVIHAIMIFEYDKIDEELDELYKEFDLKGLTGHESIEDMEGLF